MQFNGRGGGCAEDVLKGWQFGIVLRRQLRLFLLEDRQRKDISAMYKLYSQLQRVHGLSCPKSAFGSLDLR